MILEGVPLDSRRPHATVDFWRFVSRDYFQTLGIPLVEGRFFDRQDTLGSLGVVVVNQSMAKTFWPGRSPIGQRLRLGIEGSRWMTVIGVAGDIKQEGLNRGSGTEVCFLHEQAPESVGFAPRTLDVALRTEVEPMSLVSTVRKEVFLLDRTLPIDNVQTLDQVVASSVSSPRFLALLVGVFAAAALFLASVGTYGVLAFAVEQRSREIGIRMALGAQVGSVVAMVLWEGMQLVALGLVLGLGLAFACRSLLSSVLFGVSVADPLTLGALALLLASVSLIACYVPARRAASVDPLWSLQQD
jgi:predicted permease